MSAENRGNPNPDLLEAINRQYDGVDPIRLIISYPGSGERMTRAEFDIIIDARHHLRKKNQFGTLALVAASEFFSAPLPEDWREQRELAIEEGLSDYTLVVPVVSVVPQAQMEVPPPEALAA